ALSLALSLALSFPAVAVLLSLSLSFSACESGARQEAAQVVEAVDRFRKAENPGKPAAVEALRGVKCSAADVCKARDACLASAEATAKAMRLKSEVEQGLAAVEKDATPRDSQEARSLPAKLDEAESLLKEGFSLLPACDDEIMVLKRRYRI
ncbi:MAG: hypothetical protein QOI41_1630, partial [Myxococcales bacterium]|nr:hypothetical protein [Myxococcales bacterium]